MKTLISDYMSQMQFKIDLKCILFNYMIKTENTIKSQIFTNTTFLKYLNVSRSTYFS